MEKPQAKRLEDPPAIRNPVLRLILRGMISATGIALMFLGARAGLPLISLIGAVQLLVWFYLWTREDP